MYAGGIRSGEVTKLLNEQISQIIATEPEIISGNLEEHHRRLFDGAALPLIDLMQNGWSQEPFIRSIIRLHANKALFNIKWKARLHVEKGVHLLGVLDELGVLEAGQIYVRTIDRAGIDSTVQGKCITYRPPTRHPGYVQIAPISVSTANFSLIRA